ncbi:MAG: adenine phosphoribosyltransferase [Gemmatimonadaceae bacterium]
MSGRASAGERAMEARLRAAVRDVVDYPKPGILFKDITPLLASAELYRAACEALAAPYRESGVTHVVSIESRGFLLGGPVAISLGTGLVPIRKQGKLPHQTSREEYALEYGTDVLEIHTDALTSSCRVLIIDDVLATGGTACAAVRLAEGLGATIAGHAFLLELGFLGGRARLDPHRVESVIAYA